MSDDTKELWERLKAAVDERVHNEGRAPDTVLQTDDEARVIRLHVEGVPWSVGSACRAYDVPDWVLRAAPPNALADEIITDWRGHLVAAARH